MGLGKFYLVSVYDRHTDPSHKLYSNRQRALEEAKRIRMEEIEYSYGDVPSAEDLEMLQEIEYSAPLSGPEVYPTFYCGEYSCEGDRVTVTVVECMD